MGRQGPETDAVEVPLAVSLAVVLHVQERLPLPLPLLVRDGDALDVHVALGVGAVPVADRLRGLPEHDRVSVMVKDVVAAANHSGCPTGMSPRRLQRRSQGCEPAAAVTMPTAGTAMPAPTAQALAARCAFAVAAPPVGAALVWPTATAAGAPMLVRG